MILTISRQLHHQLIIVGLGSIELALHCPLVLVSKHLGALAAYFELLEMRLQTLENLTLFLRLHLSQLDTHMHAVSLWSKQFSC